MPERGIDWNDVKARVAAGQAALDDALHPQVDAVAAELRSRAAALAARDGSSAKEEQVLPVVVFRQGDNRFGLPLHVVSSIASADQCTAVPGGPPELRGIMNDRGKMHSVIDAGRLLNVNSAKSATSGYVLHIRWESGEMRLGVEAIEELRQLPADRIAACAGKKGRESAYIHAVLPDGLVILQPEGLGSLRFKKEVSS